MSEIGALNNAMLGIHRGLTGMRRNAAEIASADQFQSDSPAGLAKPLIDMRRDTVQVEASAAVVRAVDEAIGSLFDEKA